MGNNFRRKSRRDPRREGQPLAPNLDAAGKNVYAFRRFVPPSFPPLRELRGRSIRRDGWFDPTVQYQRPDILRRVLRQPPPNPNVTLGAAARRGGRPPEWLQYTQEVASKYRVADTTLKQYELYVGRGVEPDFSQVPDATSSALPVTHALAAPASGTITYKAVTRYRNEYDLLSLNQYSRSFEIDSSGNLVTLTPRDPEDIQLAQAPSFKVLVTATYWWQDDADDNADTWAIYYTDTGIDPDPSSDTPTTTAMSLTFGRERIYQEIGPFAAGDDVRVLVRVRRSSDSVESSNTAAAQITVESAPSAPDGQTFGGARAEYL